MLKKIVCTVLALVMVLATVACAATAPAPAAAPAAEPAPAVEAAPVQEAAPAEEAPFEFPEQKLTFNVDSSEISSGGQGAAKFKELVEEKTNGKVTVEVYYNGTLFNQAQQYEACIKGSTDFILNAVSNAASYIPELSTAFAPYLWEDLEHWNKFWTNEDGVKMMERIENEIGVRYISWYWGGARNVELNKDLKITSREDLKGIKLRAVPEISYQFLVEALGANPVPIPLTDAYLSIETGVVDGLEIPHGDLFSQGLDSVVKSVTTTSHMVQCLGFIVSEKNWQTYSPELQQVIMEAAQEAADFTSEINYKTAAENLQKLADQGAVIYELTPEELASYRQEVIDYCLSNETAQANWDMDLYKKMQDAAN